MAVRVELLDEAVADLADYAESGRLKQFLRKLVELEAAGPGAGQPLGRNLVGWRKIAVGDRDWRIVFRVNEAQDTATVCVIGDRNDEACYREAQRRAQAGGNEDARSLAEAMLDVMGSRKERKQTGKKRKR